MKRLASAVQKAWVRGGHVWRAIMAAVPWGCRGGKDGTDKSLSDRWAGSEWESALFFFLLGSSGHSAGLSLR